MVVFLRSTQRGAEKQVANPGLDEGEGGAVRVSGSHHHLKERGVSQRRSESVTLKGHFMNLSTMKHRNDQRLLCGWMLPTG